MFQFKSASLSLAHASVDEQTMATAYAATALLLLALPNGFVTPVEEPLAMAYQELYHQYSILSQR